MPDPLSRSVCSFFTETWKNRRLADEDDELSEVQPDAVPPEVREWLASTFTRQLATTRKKSDEKPKFRSVAHAIRAGIFVDRIYRRVSSTALMQFPPEVVKVLKVNICITAFLIQYLFSYKALGIVGVALCDVYETGLFLQFCRNRLSHHRAQTCAAPFISIFSPTFTASPTGCGCYGFNLNLFSELFSYLDRKTTPKSFHSKINISATFLPSGNKYTRNDTFSFHSTPKHHCLRRTERSGRKSFKKWEPWRKWFKLRSWF